MKKGVKEGLIILGMILAIIGVIAAICAPIIIMDYKIEQRRCQEQAEEMNLDWQYGYWIKCMVGVDGRYVDIDNYRVVQEMMEG